MIEIKVLIPKTFYVPENPSEDELKKYELFQNNEEEQSEVTICASDGQHRKCAYMPCERCIYNYYDKGK